MVFYLNLLYNNFKIIASKEDDKMKSLNNKGFVLTETLVVTTFVMVIFSILYNNFYPLMGEYELRETYDDVDSKYAVYWIKTMVEETSYPTCTNNYCQFSCSSTSDSARCEKLLKKLDISKDSSGNPNIYITSYNLTNLKINKPDSISEGFKNYIDYLPNYSTGSSTGANYRVLAEFYKRKNPLSGAGTATDYDDEVLEYYSYSTIEVVK